MMFFFSSRRRHTRFDCDWSSDVCSSDLHVDRIGSHLIRGINAETNLYTVLDDSPYWNKFPYDFDQGPLDPDLPIGYHPGPEMESALEGDDGGAPEVGGDDEDDDKA